MSKDRPRDRGSVYRWLQTAGLPKATKGLTVVELDSSGNIKQIEQDIQEIIRPESTPPRPRGKNRRSRYEE